MLLAIDIGNTNIVLGLYQGDALTAQWRLATNPPRTADEFIVLVERLFAHKGLHTGDVQAVAMCNVVPGLQEVFQRVGQGLFGVPPWTLRPTSGNTGVTLQVDYPAEVGADRIANSWAAFQRWGGPVIAVDLGTATTFDAVSEDGEFLGGAIAPGVEIAGEALFSRAARLPRVELTAPPQAIGRNTVDNMRTGLIFGYVGLVEAILTRMIKELGGRPHVVATGGLSPVIARETEMIQTIEPHLTLEGVRLLYQLNHAGREPADAGT